MTRPIYEQTAEEYDEDFRGRWQGAGGSIQSLQFAFEAAQGLLLAPYVQDMREWTFENLRLTCRRPKIHDYGCALGDGTAVIQALFPTAEVTGLDVSSVAVEVASERWPTLNFKVGNVEAPEEKADIIWTSHTLEHLRDPAEVVTNLLTLCELLVVIVPPALEGDLTHVGAEPLSEWIKRVPEPHASETFDTIRLDPHAERLAFVPERSELFVWLAS